MLVLNIIISRLTARPPKLEHEKPKGLGDFNITTATEGRPVPVIFGRVRLNGPNVLWYGDLAFSPYTWRSVTQGYHYNLGLQWGLCRGPVNALLNIWVGDKLAWTGTHVTGDPDIDILDLNFFGGDSQGSNQRGGLSGLVGLAFGTTSQAIDSYLNTKQDPAIPYHGTCYAVARNHSLNGGFYIGNDTSLDEWNFEVERYPNTLAVSGGKERIGNGANPMCVLYELLNSTEYGIGEPRTSIDVATLTALADILYSENNSFRYIWDSETTIGSLIKELEHQVDGMLFFDHATGKHTFKLFRQDYSIPAIPVIDESMITSLEDKTEASWEETFNAVRVEYSEPFKDYQQSFALAQDGANQAIVGRTNVTTIAYPGCKSATLANVLAWRDLRQESYPLAKFRFIGNRKLYGLQFGDVVQIDYRNFSMRARVFAVDYGDINDGKVGFTVLRETFHNEPGTFAPPDLTRWGESNTIPIPFNAADQVALEAPFAIIDRHDTRFTWPQLMTMARRQATSNLYASFYRAYTRQGLTSGGEEATYSSIEDVVSGPEGFGFAIVMTLRSSLLGLTSAFPADGTVDIQLDPLADDGYGYAADLDIVIPDELINTQGIGIVVIEPNTANEEWVICREVYKWSAVYPISYGIRNCYRGALDSAVKPHAAGSRVWFTFVGAQPMNGVGLLLDPSLRTYETRYYKLKLQPANPSIAAPIADCGEIPEVVVSSFRYVKPTLPRELYINDVRYPATVDSNFNTGGGVAGFKFKFLRTQWRNSRALAHVRGFDADGITPFTDPTLDTLYYSYHFYNMATGSPVSLFTANGSSGVGNDVVVILRSIVVSYTGGTMPARLRVEIQARHTPSEYPTGGYSNIASRDILTFDFDVT
jgi:hypothetical protein